VFFFNYNSLIVKDYLLSQPTTNQKAGRSNRSGSAIQIKHLQQCKCFFLSVILTKLLIKFDLELINFKYVPLYSYIKDKMKLLKGLRVVA